MEVRDFVREPTRLAGVRAHAKAPLKEAAAANATRWKRFNAPQHTGLAVETGSGARTKFKSSSLGVQLTLRSMRTASVGPMPSRDGTSRHWKSSVPAAAATSAPGSRRKDSLADV
jgi:hypothetical protein